MNEDINNSKRFTTWRIEDTHPQLADLLYVELQQVMDPELGMSIVELGLVRNIELKEGQAHVTMILTTPFCPYGPSLLEACRSKVEETLNVPTTIEMGSEVWDRSFMEEGTADWGLF
jgi:metal-sulfur cluster biosynthetic enzyme